MAVAKMHVGNRNGDVLAELNGTIGPVSWRLNKIGKTTVTLALDDAKPELLAYGNRILLEFDNGLPNWGGVIDTPLTWAKGAVAFTVYQFEHLLQYRRTVKNRDFWAAPVGAIFFELLRDTQLDEHLGVEYGQIWTGGSIHSPRYHYDDLWEIITKGLAKLQAADFRFSPLLSGGRITFKAEFFERLGEDLSARIALREGFNVAEATLTEQGKIVNDFAAAGSGTNWGDDRLVSAYIVNASRQRLGLRQGSKIYPSVGDQETLDRYTQAVCEDSAYPHVKAKLTVANLAPGTFAQYDVGDSVLVDLPSYGFDGYREKCKVETREYNPMTEKCTLVMAQEYTVEGYHSADNYDGES